MKKILSSFLLMFMVINSYAQLLKTFETNVLTKDISDKKITKYVSYKWNENAYKARRSVIPLLANLPKIQNSNALMELPLDDGSLHSFYIAEVKVLSDATAQLYPDIKTYDVKAVDDDITGRITIAPSGVRAMLLTKNGRVNIEPVSKDNATDHIVFASKDQLLATNVICGVKDEMNKNDMNAWSKTTQLFGDCTLRTYNLAVATTGEYTTLAGSQANAIAAATANIANISLLYENELAIKFTMVTNNAVIYQNASTDPYPTVSFPTQAVLDSNTSALNSGIGAANYDLGIVFNDGWSGGLAYTPGLCNASLKGGASAGMPNATTGSILENVAAHELAHMFSATHTMSTGTGSVCIDNLSLSSAYEIGGGSTLMAYAGAVCSGFYYQNNTDGYFHYNSLNTVLTYAQSLSTCGVSSALTNNAPTLTVASNSYTIPKSTPFELTANGADADVTNVLKYNFDEYDVASSAMTTLPSSTTTSGPMFRSYPYTTSNARIFPALTNVLNNTTSTWEVLPSVTRTLNFKAMVRDQATGGGCLAQESIAVNVNSGSGPFEITSNNSANTYTFGGSPIALTWNVASTTAIPVSAANVDVLLSTDNGQTFPYTLLSNTPNDGSESIPVPSINTYSARIKVKASNNIFLDINNAKQIITSSCGANGASFSPDGLVSAVAGNSALNLGLAPNYGSALSISGTLALTDPSTTLSVANSGSCVTFSNQFNYDTYSFQVNVAGSYTFSLSAATSFGTIINLYENSFDPSNTCTNFVTSNGAYSGSSISINNSFTASLLPGVTYVLAAGTFNAASSPTYPNPLPSSYGVTVSAPTGGGIYSGAINPGTSYSYTFVVVNSTTGNIVAFSSNGDMTNSTTFPAGNYTVYGLSYSNSVTTTTLNSYVGTSFSTFKTALLNNTICGNISDNSKTVIVGTVLDLQSLKLSGTAQQENVKLVWNIVGAKNIDRYVVEKSMDGNAYKTIGNVTAEQDKSVYTFYDEDAYNGANFYRIKAIDEAGAIQYSNMVLINFNALTKYGVTLYPNPAKDYTTISTDDKAVYECTLSDLSGKTIQHFKLDTQYNLNTKGLTKGMYLLHGNNSSKSFVLKLLID